MCEGVLGMLLKTDMDDDDDGDQEFRKDLQERRVHRREGCNYKPSPVQR